MKVNEVPEKIYLSYETDEDDKDNIFIDYMWHRHPFEGKNLKNVEYTHTDAFVEKTCEWLEPVLKNYAGYYVGKDILEDFKNYMEDKQ